jgi:hypothetical protein
MRDRVQQHLCVYQFSWLAEGFTDMHCDVAACWIGIDMDGGGEKFV